MPEKKPVCDFTGAPLEAPGVLNVVVDLGERHKVTIVPHVHEAGVTFGNARIGPKAAAALAEAVKEAFRRLQKG